MTNARTNRRGAAGAVVLLSLMIGLGAGCGPYFSQIALNNATSLKDKSLLTLGKATTPYADHKDEVEALQNEVNEAYKFAQGQPKNEASAKQWALMRDPQGNLLGGALQRWRTQGEFSSTFATEVSDQVSRGFDQIIDLESQKPKK